MATVQDLISDPAWGKLSSSERAGFLDKTLSSDPGWAKLSRDQQADMQRRAYAKGGIEGYKSADSLDPLKWIPGLDPSRPPTVSSDNEPQPAGPPSSVMGELKKAAGVLAGPIGAMATEAIKPETLLKTGAFMAGEAATGNPAIASGISAVTGTAADAAIAYLKGLSPDKVLQALPKDLLLNALMTYGGAGLGKLAEGQLESETTAVKQAVDRSMAAKARYQESALGAVSPQAQAEAIRQATGATTEKTASAIIPPGELTESGLEFPSAQTLREQAGPRNVYFDVHDKLDADLSKPYQEIGKSHGNAQLTDTTDIATATNEIDTEWLTERRGQALPEVAKELRAHANDIHPIGMLDRPAATIKGPISRAARLASSESGLEPIDVEQSATLNSLLAFKRDAQKLMISSKDPDVRHVARMYVDASNEALSKGFKAGDLPPEIETKLNDAAARWRAFKEYFPRSDLAKMSKAGNPIIAGEYLFNNPKAGYWVAKGADTKQRGVLRDAFEKWSDLHPGDVIAKGADRAAMTRDAAAKAKFYGTLYPDSPFSNPHSLIYLGATAKNVSESPVLQQLFGRAGDQTLQEIRIEAAPAVVRIARQRAKELGGPSGDALNRILDTAERTGGAQAAAVAASKWFTGTSPEQVVQDIAQSQKLLGSSVARQMARPYEASKYRSWIQHLASNVAAWPWMAGYGLYNMAKFGTPGFMGTIAIAGTGPVVQRLVANVAVRGLKDPKVAAEFFNPMKAMRIGVMRPAAKVMVKSTYDTVGNMLNDYAQHNPIESAEEPEEEESGEAAAAH